VAKKGGGQSKDAQIARADEQARQDRIRTGTGAINTVFDSQFNEPYFDERRNAYSAYATPQLEQQADDARKQLVFGLSRSGLSNSSVAAQKEGEFQRTLDQGRQQIADTGNAQAGQARTSVEDARSNLVSALNASGDNTLTANSALSRAKAVSEPEAYSPIGQVFGAFTSGLGAQAAAERASAIAGQGGAYKSPYALGLYDNKSGVQVQR
jgi:hypothetical protein